MTAAFILDTLWAVLVPLLGIWRGVYVTKVGPICHLSRAKIDPTRAQ